MLNTYCVLGTNQGDRERVVNKANTILDSECSNNSILGTLAGRLWVVCFSHPLGAEAGTYSLSYPKGFSHIGR
jgi:hypothetical protein